MSKLKPINPERRPYPEIKPIKHNEFEKIFGNCNKAVCKDEARILLYHKDQFCNILTNSESFQDEISFAKESCVLMDRKPSVVGFFIEPFSPPQYEQNNNYLKIQPIHYAQNQNNYGEHLTSHDEIRTNEFASYNLDSSPFVFPQLGDNSFNHNIFQFNGVAIDNEFMKAYISWYELKCILDHCDYIGICGSLVMSGNFGVFEKDDKGFLQAKCNNGYFTYRVIGFKKYYNDEKNRNLPDWAKLKLNGKTEFLLKSNQELKDGGVVPNFRIPTETWASPCPPMWRPN